MEMTPALIEVRDLAVQATAKLAAELARIATDPDVHSRVLDHLSAAIRHSRELALDLRLYATEDPTPRTDPQMTSRSNMGKSLP